MKFFLQGLSVAAVAAAAILIVWRTLPIMGAPLKRRIDKPFEAAGYIPGKKECAKVFGYSMLFRLFVLAAGFVVYCIFVDNGKMLRLDKIFDVWMKWDARHYIDASHGYASYTEKGDFTNLVFFPLYPWLLAALNVIVRNESASAVLVSALASSGAAVYMYKLLCPDYGKRAAELTVILIFVFPFSFFYGGIMTEGVFLLTCAATFYYVRNHNWIAAGIAGFLCALSRSAGVFLIFPATVELLEQEEIFRDFGKKLLPALKKWVWLLLLPIGTCVYLFINYRITGDPLYFLKIEKKIWFQESQPFFKTVGTLWDTASGNRDISVRMGAFAPGLVVLFATYAVMLLGIRRNRTMYSVWLLVYALVNTSMSWPLSLGRYFSAALPTFIILGDVCSRNRKLRAAFLIGFPILFGIYMTGYIMQKQIM